MDVEPIQSWAEFGKHVSAVSADVVRSVAVVSGDDRDAVLAKLKAADRCLYCVVLARLNGTWPPSDLTVQD